MSKSDTNKTGIVIHQILSVYDDIRMKVIREVVAPMQKRQHGLTSRQSAAVDQVKLLMNDHPNGVALKTLANHLQMAVSATSILVESMVNKGVFERTPNPVDRRAVCIRLTSKGEAIYRDMHELLLQRIADIVSVLAAEEVEQLRQITHKLSTKVFG